MTQPQYVALDRTRFVALDYRRFKTAAATEVSWLSLLGLLLVILIGGGLMWFGIDWSLNHFTLQDRAITVFAFGLGALMWAAAGGSK